MHKICAVLFFFLAFSATSVLEARAGVCGFLGIRVPCAETSSGAKSPTSFPDNSLIRDRRRASYSYNQFTFFRLKERPNLGYTVVEFSMVDPEDNQFQERFANAPELIQRSLFDWVRSLFVTQGKVFIVSIDVYSDEAEKNLISHRPIFVARHDSSFRAEQVENILALNGTIGFPRLSDRPHRVKLTVRHAESSEFTSEDVEGLIELSRTVTQSVPKVSSLVEDSTLLALKEASQELLTLLGRFEVSTEMSRSLTLSHEENEIVGFKYDFFAPNEVNIPRVKLLVGLKHSPSLLTGGGASSSGDILSKSVHWSDQVAFTLSEYIRRHDLSSDDIATLSSPSPDIPKICSAIREALLDRFTARDTTIALNAFITQNANLFVESWNPNCFIADDAVVLEESGFTRFSVNQNDFDNSFQMSLSSQTRFVRLINLVLRKGVGEEDAAVISELANEQMASNSQITIKDDVGFFFGRSISGIQTSPGDLIKLVREAELDLGLTLRCYSGDMYDTTDQPNVLGTLTQIDEKAVEFLFEYAPGGFDPARPLLKRIVVRFPSRDQLFKYRDGTQERANAGCAGGFKPWLLQSEGT